MDALGGDGAGAERAYSGIRSGRRTVRTGESGHSDLDVGRAASYRHLRPQAERGLRLHGAARWCARHECPGHTGGRTSAPACRACRQVLHHPQHDAREQRPRDGRLHRADRPPPGRQDRLPVTWRHRLAAQGLRWRL